MILACWSITYARFNSQTAFVQFVTSVPNGLAWVVNTVWWLSSLGTIVVLSALALLSGRREWIRDVALSGGAAWLISLALSSILGPDAAHSPTPGLDGINLGFPLARVAVTVAVATASLPYLSRMLQRVTLFAIGFVLVTTVVHGSGMPIAVVASFEIGWGLTAASHLVFGSPLGVLSVDEVAGLLAHIGIHAHDLAPAPRQVWEVAQFTGSDDKGPIDISVYGRDSHDAQLLAKVFRHVVYRASGATLALTRLQQVEHQAFVTLMAARSDARVPMVVGAGTAGPARDAVLVTTPPSGQRLSELAEPPDLSDAFAEDLLRQLLKLRVVSIAHGAVSAQTAIVGPQETAGLVDFQNATINGMPGQMDRDLAGALATLALEIGPERTTEVAARVVPPDALAAALPFLQRSALGSVQSKALRGKKQLLADLREQGAQVAGVPVPELVEPRRISWVNLAMVLGTLIGGWALIGVLINVTKSWSTITGADWGWVALTFVLAQLTFPAVAATTTGSVVDPLAFGRVVALEVANSFVALAGGTMAVLATRVRFFQQYGYSATLAVSSGAVSSTASWIVKGGLFLIALPFAISNFHFGDEQTSGGHKHLVWLLLLVLVAAMVVLGLILLVPRLRNMAKDKLRPKLSEVWSHLRVLGGHPRKLVEIFGGDTAAQLLVAMALGTALHAFGESLSLATLLVALTLASMLGGISPVPGGMGVVEAGMILALTAAGVPESQAVAAVFVQRLFTSYLPPIWGWFVLVWLRKKEYL